MCAGTQLVVAMIEFPEFHVDETVVHLSHHTGIVPALLVTLNLLYHLCG
jgi:hypothetical protein